MLSVVKVVFRQGALAAYVDGRPLLLICSDLLWSFPEEYNSAVNVYMLNCNPEKIFSAVNNRWYLITHGSKASRVGANGCTRRSPYRCREHAILLCCNGGTMSRNRYIFMRLRPVGGCHSRDGSS